MHYNVLNTIFYHILQVMVDTVMQGGKMSNCEEDIGDFLLKLKAFSGSSNFQVKPMDDLLNIFL